MKKLYIYPNLTEERYIEKVKKALNVLEDKGYECNLRKKDGELLFGKTYKPKRDIDDCDLIVTLGGDGTFLRGTKLAIEKDMKICGINCGNLGFLCAYQLKDIDKVDFNSLKTSKSNVLEFDYNNNTFIALNEVVVGKDYFGGTVELEYKTKKLSNRFKGDGLIICTATGSTAYNISAGGKAFKDEDEIIGITPICAYTKGIKPECVNEKEVIKIKLVDSKYTASIFADGILIGQLDEIDIKLSKRKAKILKK